MDLEIKSNRQCLITTLLVPTIFGVVSLIYFIIYYCVGVYCMEAVDGMKEFWALFIYGVFVAVLICIILVVKFYKGTIFKFTDDYICVYKKRRETETICVNEIEEINFYAFKWRYIITIFAGALNEGGCWQLHVKMKNGEKKKLRYFTLKEVKRIKDKYGDLINIY